MEIKIKKGEDTKWYNMPNTWDEIPLDKYMKVMDYLTNDKVDKHTLLIMMIHHLTNIPEYVLWHLPMPDITAISAPLTVMMQGEANQELKHIIKVKGKKYGFNPRLRDISMGEFVDIERCVKDGLYKNMHTMLSILYRPVVKEDGDKYLIEEYEPSDKRADLFRDNLKVDDFNGASVFFYTLGLQLLETTSKYLRPEIMRERLKLLKTNGDGTRLSTN